MTNNIHYILYAFSTAFLVMEVGTIQAATEEDFGKLWNLVSNDNIWKLEYQKDEVIVWSKHSSAGDVKTIKVFGNISV